MHVSVIIQRYLEFYKTVFRAIYVPKRNATIYLTLSNSPLADVKDPGHGHLCHPDGALHTPEADVVEAPVPVVVIVGAELARAGLDSVPEVAVPDHAHVVLGALEDRVDNHLERDSVSIALGIGYLCL